LNYAAAAQQPSGGASAAGETNMNDLLFVVEEPLAFMVFWLWTDFIRFPCFQPVTSAKNLDATSLK
jgi:hypothetical protein